MPHGPTKKSNCLKNKMGLIMFLRDIFTWRWRVNRIRINGVDIVGGSDVSIYSQEGDVRVRIDGELITVPRKNPMEIRVLEGTIHNLLTDGSVVCKDVTGNVTAKGSVTCDAILRGDVEAGGSVTCDAVGGSVRAGGSVSCDDVGGDVQAGGSVSCDDVGGDVRATTVRMG